MNQKPPTGTAGLSAKAERASSALRDQLRTAGLRATIPRLAVLGWLADHPHTTADQVAAAVRGSIGSVSTQAIYDVLNVFTRLKLVRRIEPAGHPARFETRTGDNHHHLLCRSCGRAEDVDCVVGVAPCLEPADAAGYVVDEAEVVFWGLCPNCLLDAGAPNRGDDNDKEYQA